MDGSQDQLHDLWDSAQNENVVPLFRYYYKCHGSDSRALSPAWTLLSMGACATAGELQSSGWPLSTPARRHPFRKHFYMWW